MSSSVLGEPVFYQWLFEGESIDGASSYLHYPDEVGVYQVYAEDINGCFDYSEEVFLPFVGLRKFTENSLSI